MRAFVNGCGIAAVLLIGAYGIGAAVPIGGPPSANEYQQAQTEQPAPEPAPPAVTQEEQARAWDESKPCDAPESREESDLCQQWRMAEASEELVTLTDRQNMLTTIEAGLLAVTIIFTAVAAYAAVVAAKAAQASVKVAQGTAKQQLRAYVGLSAAGVEEGPQEGPAAIITFKNAGQTPAYRLAGWIDAASGERTDFRRRPDSAAISVTDLSPGADYEVPVYLPGAEEILLRAVFNDGPAFYVWGELVYQDAFGETGRHTRFRLVSVFNHTKAGYGLVCCEEGNESN